ncbi:ABC transporter substrate-binding protein [Streptomyces sp. NPDC127097]|uniref:ABC transporter substrate-binding protein n=1 Tax=Streptomyces sp. NPDC127097 TaxID=3347136 RepID=UPI003649146D
MSAALLVAGVSTTLALLNGGQGESGDGTSKHGTTEATYNAAVGHILKPGGGKGVTLKFGSAADADSWDPQRSYYGSVANFARYYTRQLVTYDPRSRGTALTPDLATSKARISHQGRTYTYTLRKGMTWEDGSPVTSGDIKYGIERLWAADVITGGPGHLMEALDPEGNYRGPYKDISAKGLKRSRRPVPEPSSSNCPALTSALGKIGIEAKADRFDGARMTTLVGVPNEVRKRGYGIVLTSWSADFPTGQAFWRPLVDSRTQSPSGNANLADVDSPALDKLLDKAVAEADPKAAGEIYEEINHQVSEGAYYLPLVYGRYVSWRSPRLTDVHVADAYGGYDYVRLGVRGT